jgi:hypothetical protein
MKYIQFVIVAFQKLAHHQGQVFIIFDEQNIGHWFSPGQRHATQFGLSMSIECTLVVAPK